MAGALLGLVLVPAAVPVATAEEGAPADPPAGQEPARPQVARTDTGAGIAPDYARPGFYVYFGGATGFDTAAADTINALAGVTGLVEVEPAIGLNARIGGRTNRFFAAEIQVEYLPAFDFAVGPLTFAEVRTVTLTSNLKLILSTGRFQPYVLLGGGGLFAEVGSPFVPGLAVSASGFALRGGGGFETWLTENVAIVIDASYVWPTGEAEDLDYVSLGWGIQYRF